MTVQSGERDRKITFERQTARQSGMGRERPTASTALGSEWAKVLFGTGQERRVAGAEGATQSATFRVLSNSTTRGVSETDVIRFDGRVWDITSIAPIGVNDEIEFTATAGKG